MRVRVIDLSWKLISAKKQKKLTLGKRPVVNHLRRLVETLTHIVSIYVWLVY